MASAGPEALPERELNALLRRVDWRFLLGAREAPEVADLTGGKTSRAVALIAAGTSPPPGCAAVAVTGYPTRLGLRGAVDAIRPGGEVVCLWRTPRPAAAGRAAARMRAAGLVDVRVHWPGPIPFRAPQFWLPLDSRPAAAHLLESRPPRSRWQAMLRPLWRAAARGGLLAPLCAIGRLPGGDREAGTTPGAIDAIAPPSSPLLLLSGGGRSINKVVGLPFDAGKATPSAIVKFARVPAADRALEREAEALRLLEEEHPQVSGIPRLLGRERRAGRTALAESGVFGRPLIAELTAESFASLASLVSDWLVGLVGVEEKPARSEWWERLVGGPLATFERDFGAVAAPDTIVRIRRHLEELDDLPPACEHRDCSPWNVLLGPDGAPALLDWESAEPHGLPGLDLAYFLANAAFLLDGALASGGTRESYLWLLDPGSRHGREAAACAASYRDRVGLSEAAWWRLRLLCWVVHSRSDHRHLTMAAAGTPTAEALRGSTYLGLIEAELDLEPGA